MEGWFEKYLIKSEQMHRHPCQVYRYYRYSNNCSKCNRKLLVFIVTKLIHLVMINTEKYAYCNLNFCTFIFFILRIYVLCFTTNIDVT